MTRRWYRPTYADECAAFHDEQRSRRAPTRPAWPGAIVLVLAIVAVLWPVLR